VVHRPESPGDRDYACNHIPSYGTFLVRLNHVDLDLYRSGIYVYLLSVTIIYVYERSHSVYRNAGLAFTRPCMQRKSGCGSLLALLGRGKVQVEAGLLKPMPCAN
jgi:hypothetical protein